MVRRFSPAVVKQIRVRMSRPQLLVGIGIVFFLPLALLGVAFLGRIGYELRGPLNWDSPLYLGVGRGIVNGLAPYTDMFESKPPGIFLLSALSFLLGGRTLIAMTQASALIAFPVGLGLFAVRAMKGKPLGTAIFLIILTVLFGMLLAVYTGERSGEFQVESFGAAAGVLYVVVVALPWRRQWLGLLSTTVFLGAAIGFKEPFLFSCLAAALIVGCEKWKRFLASFMLPLLLVCLIGVITLLLLRSLWGYLTVYLPLMHDYTNGVVPAWRRAFEFKRLWEDAIAFAPPFPFLLASFAVGWVLPSSLGRTSLIRTARSAIVLPIAFYLMSLSVGIGGQYYNHHFVFAVPVWAAFCIAWIQRSQRVGLVGIIIVMLLTATALHLPHIDFEERWRANSRDVARMENVAKRIDTILDRCNVDRYLFLGGNGFQPYGFTLHSPLGPNFFQYPYHFDPARTYFRSTFQHNLNQAQVIVWNNDLLGSMSSTAHDALRMFFSLQPRPCAEGIPLPPPYQLYFRVRDTDPRSL